MHFIRTVDRLNEKRLVNIWIQIRMLFQIVVPSLLDENTLAGHSFGPPSVVNIGRQVANRYNLAPGRCSQKAKARGNPRGRRGLVRHILSSFTLKRDRHYPTRVTEPAGSDSILPVGHICS